MSNHKPNQKANEYWNQFYHNAFSATREVIETSILEFKKVDRLINGGKERAGLGDLNLNFIRSTLMASVILDMAKLFGTTRNDEGNIDNVIKYIKGCVGVPLVNKLKKIQAAYKPTIEKITKNRNKLIGHLDFFKDPYFNMLYSPEEEKRRLTRSEGRISSKKQVDQRYGLVDFRKELKFFKKMLAALDGIYSKINHEYEKIFYPN